MHVADDSSVSSSETKSSRKHRHARALHCHHAEGLTDYINTLEFASPATKDSKEAVVVVHGYAAALGFFFRNWDAVARAADATGRRTFFLDWLGMGLSSRPNPSILAAPAGAPLEARVARAEHFFLSSLEAWRAAEGIERMVLVGHSLGGYLSSAYALKYPERVSSLILVSPAGIPHGKLGDKPPVPPPTTQPAPVTERASLDAAADAAESEMHDPAASAAEAQAAAHPQQSATRRGVTKFLLWGWEKGLSPFSILRGMGPWGPLLVGKYSSRRFASQSADDVRDLHAYIYGTSVMRGSGEFCISHLLAPGAYARMPIVDRISPLKVPVTFMYGDSDWMDVEGGRAAQKVLAEAGNTDVDVHVVKNAGHHLYLDNPDDSNAIIEAAIRAAPKLETN
jgi:cardiolipin-specific phospholipase